MGARTDMTGNAGNIRERTSTASMASQAPNALSPSDNLGQRAPRFMSPTVSSTKQTSAKTSTQSNRATTPSASSSKPSGSGNWMSSAAQRVGLGRVGDGIPRSRKEGPIKQPTKAVSFPDKLASTPYSGGLPDSPASSKGSKVSKASVDKPLPSPPVAQILSTSPLKMNRSLIDASEQPLRRSPPGKPYEEEEWPVLFPDRPTTPGTLNAMVEHQHSVIATNPPQIKERYPLLPSSSYGPAYNVERKSTEKSFSISKIQRKQVSSSSLRQDPKDQKVFLTNKENVSPRKDVPNNDRRLGRDRSSGSPSKIPGLTAGAAAIEKASYESKPTIEPRQTRTSSLRARLSGGQVIKDSPTGTNRALGFNDFTTSSALPTEQLEVPPTPVLAPVKTTGLGKKASRESMRGKRPAQIVAGSRRVPSRGSLRNDTRTSSHSSQVPPPSRTAPTIPDMSKKESSLANSSPEFKEPEAAPRKSSLPTYRQAVSTVATQADGKLIPAKNKGSETHSSKTNLDPHTFGIFEDTNKDHETSALGAIEESPRTGYHIKRLSVNSPEHGPTLKISPSADRLIMGTGSDKENEPDNKKKRSKDVSRSLGAKDLYSSSKIRPPLRPSTQTQTHSRPSSSQGLPLSASRPKLDSESRAKKVRSADVGDSIGVDHLMRLSGKEKPKSSRKNTDSTSDDPFFDAQSSLDKRISRATDSEQRPSAQNGLFQLDNASWIEPVHKHLNATADTDASLIPADVLSIITREEHASLLAAPTPDASLSISKQHPTDKPEDLPSFELTPPKTAELVPTTPEQGVGKASSNNSGSLPPRSSSRTAHPDFTGKKSSPASPFGKVPVDFTNRQNRLGSVGGHGTSQIDFAVPASNRTSIAQESQKSHGSVSKGVLSKFGGLFHKRHSDEQNTGVKSSKKSKQKVSITSNGSPFPPISEIHPVHRPTLSSSRRANGNPPRSPLPDFVPNDASTPAFNSPVPTEVSTTTTLAMEILDSARKECSSPKKERLLELGKIMVDALTQARDAERAMEEAKQAARKAEVAHALCKKSIGDISKLIVDWKADMARGGPH